MSLPAELKGFQDKMLWTIKLARGDKGSWPDLMGWRAREIATKKPVYDGPDSSWQTIDMVLD